MTLPLQRIVFDENQTSPASFETSLAMRPGPGRHERLEPVISLPDARARAPLWAPGSKGERDETRSRTDTVHARTRLSGVIGRRGPDRSAKPPGRPRRLQGDIRGSELSRHRSGPEERGP